MKKRVLPCFMLVVLLAAPAWADLTGRWSCNDGGVYYLRQTRDQVCWYGEAGDRQPAWANVFFGRIRAGRITGSWADVPKGQTAGSGRLELLIGEDGNTLGVVGKTGGFGGSRWVRLATRTAAERSLTPLKPSGDGGCVQFDPAAVVLRQVNGSWKIVAGSHWLFDFGADADAAGMALKVIRHYRVDRVCAIGRPVPALTYLLAKGGAPSGAMSGEDCLAFDPMGIRVSKIQGSWKIIDGRRWLYDFGQNQTEARQAFALIRRHGFSQACFVGRPDPGLTYLRR